MPLQPIMGLCVYPALLDTVTNPLCMLQLQSGIQFVNLPQQRATLKPGTSLQGTLGVKATTVSQGPLTTSMQAC
ncbi:hypothetical protein DPMN_105692 [Dreissena polymorpha]|uniref:Uncharacterized protein n=1 Tax=Dreissena polymorpha TaxID=45954 RepID=A0A9D4K3N5_DREPO|nr:hypothetical protein DPMN_105692 [Dreissena polymorpha]